MAVYFARFIAALRVLAGPLAGVLRMRWVKFLLFNALGAMSWVALITALAYLLGPSLEPILRHLGWALAVMVVLAIIHWWIKRVRHTRVGDRGTSPRPKHLLLLF
jgi:membrane protein DedA with SNARE-associated domain